MPALVVFAFSYIALSIGRVPGLRTDRLAAAIIGATLMVAVGGLRLSAAQAAIDGNTLALLFGMMILSAALELSGAFELVGWWVAKRRPKPLTLLAGVCALTAVASAFFINDVVCLAFTPVVLRITEELELDPRPHLLGLATASNIGSVATITGNPQNILIGSLSGIHYRDFSAALAPVAALSLLANLAVLAFVHRRTLAAPPGDRPVRRQPSYYRRWLYKAIVISTAVLAGFIAGAPPALVALLGGSAVLVTRAVHPKRVYARIDWGLLALFVGLFVITAGVEGVGLGEKLVHALHWLDPGSVPGLTALTAVASNLLSNVPAVMVLKSAVPHLPDPQRAWLVLAMASTLAGNVTLLGSLATMIVVEKAKHRVKIGFFDFLKVGLPSALISLAIGVAWLTWVAR